MVFRPSRRTVLGSVAATLVDLPLARAQTPTEPRVLEVRPGEIALQGEGENPRLHVRRRGARPRAPGEGR